MAWITKPSATTRIETRDEPYLTEEMKSRLTDTMLPRFETTHAALLPALHEIQHHYGWVPPQAMQEVAQFLKIPAAEVLDTASFYEEYWLKPKGKALVSVCRSIACEFCGQPELTEAVKQQLGIDVGETTPDGEITLVELECMGSCGTAPVALVNEDLHENLTPDRLCAIVDQVRQGTYTHGGTGAVRPDLAD